MLIIGGVIMVTMIRSPWLMFGILGSNRKLSNTNNNQHEIFYGTRNAEVSSAFKVDPVTVPWNGLRNYSVNVLADSGASRLYFKDITFPGLRGNLGNYQFNQAAALSLGHRVGHLRPDNKGEYIARRSTPRRSRSI